MKKYSLINKKTNVPIKVSITDIGGDCGDWYYFTESDFGFYWFVDTEEEVNIAVEPYESYIYNSIKRPHIDSLDISDYIIKEVEIKY